MSILYDSHGDPSILPARPTVTRYYPIKGSTTLRAFVSVLFPGGLHVHSIRLHARDGKRWVSFPDQPYKRRNGEIGYQPILEFSTAEEQNRFQAEVLAAISRFHGGHDADGQQ